MKSFIFAIFTALVILQVTMAMPIENGEEEVEIDPAKLHKAIKNMGKFQKALKQIEVKLSISTMGSKAIHKKVLVMILELLEVVLAKLLIGFLSLRF
uniref:Uncharacterized protein n=1 Tax=Panagrolaimus superbus TaxID=310955 RepID=A0A914Y7L9_9BILA